MKKIKPFFLLTLLISLSIFFFPGLPSMAVPNSEKPHEAVTKALPGSSAETPWVGLTETDLGTNLFVRTSDGFKTLVTGWDNMSPSISHDGTMVVFVSDRPDESRPAMVPASGGGYEVWVARVDGSGLRRLTSMGRFAAAPSFGHDGRWVYFSSSDEGLNFKAARIMRVSITGIRGPETVLEAPPKIEYPKTRLSTPRISRDGEKLFFTMSEIPHEGAMTYGFMAVFSVDLPKGGGVANFDDCDKIAGGTTFFDDLGKPVGTMASAPSVAPDGKVVFVSYAGRTETSVMLHNGKSSALLLHPGEGIHLSPTVSPKGSTLIYGTMTSDGIIWTARDLAADVESPLSIPAGEVEGRLVHAGY